MAVRKKKILIVEDDPTQAMMYEVALSAAGYKTIIVNTAKTGIAAAQKEKPDLIYLDMILGDMQGSDVINILKSDNSTKDLKIVILSNLNKKEIIDKCKSLGATDFLIKMQYLPKDIVGKTKEYLI